MRVFINEQEKWFEADHLCSQENLHNMKTVPLNQKSKSTAKSSRYFMCGREKGVYIINFSFCEEGFGDFNLVSSVAAPTFDILLDLQDSRRKIECSGSIHVSGGYKAVLTLERPTPAEINLLLQVASTGWPPL